MAIVAAVYMRILLPESIRDENLYTPILSKEKVAVSSPDEESARKMQVFKRLPSIEDMVCLLKSR